MVEKTLAIIKPDAIASGVSGAIIQLIELNKFKILKIDKKLINKEQAKKFYEVHKNKPFYNELVDYISSGPVIIMVLEKENAITAWRELMGATDPNKAAYGTIRKMFGKSISSNVTHGSDSPENARNEINFFFPNLV